MGVEVLYEILADDGMLWGTLVQKVHSIWVKSISGYFPVDMNLFTHEVVTPRYPANSAPEYPNSLIPTQDTICLTFTILCLRLPDRSSPTEIL